jgi:hypothetical protein
MKLKEMFEANYDLRSIDSIADNLFFYRIIGKKIIKLNFSNIVPGEICLVDILQEYPDIMALGIGIGNNPSIFERRRTSMYNALFIKHIIIHFSPQSSPTFVLPKNLDELALEFPFIVEGKTVSDYLKKIIVKDCRPVLRLIHLENVTKIEDFTPPDNVRMVVCRRSRETPPVTNFIQRMIELGFKKTDEEREYIFERKG